MMDQEVDRPLDVRDELVLLQLDVADDNAEAEDILSSFLTLFWSSLIFAVTSPPLSRRVGNLPAVSTQGQ